MNRVTCPYCSRSGISVSLHADSATTGPSVDSRGQA